MISISQVLANLAAQRPIFHSEADFQHALAWQLHRQLPGASIRLELPVSLLSEQRYIDVWITLEDIILAIELKYKTRALSVQIGDEQFSLKNQSAQDIGRYDFVKDVQRLEQVVQNHPKAGGYAVLLTNDSAYWKPPTRQTIDADFRLHRDRVLQGILEWDAGASRGTTKSRERPLDLSGTYNLTWKVYSEPSPGNSGQFRYLAIKVGKFNDQ